MNLTVNLKLNVMSTHCLNQVLTLKVKYFLSLKHCSILKEIHLRNLMWRDFQMLIHDLNKRAIQKLILMHSQTHVMSLKANDFLNLTQRLNLMSRDSLMRKAMQTQTLIDG